jgi:hypothetical protein
MELNEFKRIFSFNVCSTVAFLKKTAITVFIALLLLSLDMVINKKESARIPIKAIVYVSVRHCKASGTSETVSLKKRLNCTLMYFGLLYKVNIL